MSTRVLVGHYDGTRRGACLVDSVTETCFGPLFASHDEAEDFREYVEDCEGCDVREVSAEDLAAQARTFRMFSPCDDCGRRRDKDADGRCAPCASKHAALPECEACGEHHGGAGRICDDCGIIRADAREIARGLR